MKVKHIKTFEEPISELNISGVSDSEIIIGNYYNIDEYDTKVVVVDKNDDRQKAFVTSDLVDKTGAFWINYNKLSAIKDGHIFTNK
jgi:hypothetical protein